MKSTEVSPNLRKPRGRPAIRKIKNQQKNSSALESENIKSILEFFSPPRTNTVSAEEPKRSGSTPRRKKNPLAHLQSNLSPKYIGFSTPTSSEKRMSKYRIANLKDSNSSASYFRSNGSLMGYVRRRSVSGRLMTPLSSPEMNRRSSGFVSPIDKLLRKNGAMKSLPNSPVGNSEIFSEGETVVEKWAVQNNQRHCIVKLEQMGSNEFVAVNSDLTCPVKAELKELVDNVHTSDILNIKDTVEVKEVAYSPVVLENQEKYTNELKIVKGVKVADEPIEVSESTENAIADSVDDTYKSYKANSKQKDLHLLDNNELKHETFNNANRVEQMLNLEESKFSNDDLPSLKSPSTLSVDSAKGSSLDNDLNWVSIESGDLFWGQIFQFAYWPCIVCPDPEGKTIRVNEIRGQMQHVMIHVRFFADNGRRSWVKRDNLMPFNGLDMYRKKMDEAEEKYGKRNNKYKMFVVAPKKRELWDQAVREAEVMESISVEDRMVKFFQQLEEVKVYNTIQRKRRQSLYMTHSSTSDISSMFDSTDNLYLKHTAKRDRSPTPVSPAYSPLGPRNAEKRIKLDVHNTSRSSNFSSLMDEGDPQPNDVPTGNELQHRQSEEIYNDVEFKKFVAAMRPFALEGSTDPKLETQFMFHVRSIWALKHITFRNRVETSLSEPKTPVGVKRLSQRIRNISIRKSLPSTPIPAPQHAQILPEKNTTLKPKRAIVRPIDEVIDDIYNLDNKYLFRGVSKDQVCKECLQPGSDLFKCSKNCHGWLHSACSANLSCESPLPVTDLVPSTFVHITGDLDDTTTASQEHQNSKVVTCNECISGEPKKCFVCNMNTAESGEMARCNSMHCGKSYHPSCLKYWPQAKLTKSAGKLESLRCPAHVCHTCVSDNPKGKFLQIEKSKLTKCFKCPATYHMDSTCIPAGSHFLSAACIICPRHSKQQEPFINVNWCFICVAGGNLICCETCPTAVHAECLKIPIADEGYFCEECETGRMPLYGEMVWAKFNNFRWWPSLILPPTEVPANLARKAHNPSEFVIRFFGTNDHAWISRRRVYLYQEGDCSGPAKNQRNSLDYNYVKGVAEAKRIAEIIKEKKIVLRANDKKQRISPLPYVKIKMNRAVPPIKLQVDLENISKCECNKDSENPCSQDSGCLNRVLFNECNPKICAAGDRCQNQMFEKKVYPKVDVLYMNEKGFGLISLEPITAGTFVIEYVGEVIDDAEFRRRIAQKEQERDENFYFLSLEKDYIIDAGPKGNLARFMNHSCDPNCETQKWSVNGLNRIGLFAIKDIPANTELTFNYFWDELLGNEKKNCHCGAAKCAGLIGGKYKEPVKNISSKYPSDSNIIPSVKPKKKAKLKLKAQKTIRKRRTKKTDAKEKNLAPPTNHTTSTGTSPEEVSPASNTVSDSNQKIPSSHTSPVDPNLPETQRDK